jgi:thiol-disulfide isomerase/thioredoxin
MATEKISVLLLSLLAMGSIGAHAERSGEGNHVSRHATPQSVQLPIEGKLPSLQGAVEWLNSEPLSPAQLRGKVVLVEFWTYTCINWRRTLPYVHAWAEKYKNHGLVVIGIHTPEFAFEKDLTNVQHAVNAIKIDFPVAVDSNYAIWNSFGNRYWPALYFVDAQGRIRHHQFGEGSYEQSERVLQQLLTEAGNTGWSQDLTPVTGQGAEAAADWSSLKSGETYLAYERSETFASPGGMARKANHTYAFPARLDLNEWALSGDWTVGSDAVVLNRPSGRIAYRFHARDVHLIMGSGQLGHAIRFRVLIDGQPPGAAHGADVDAQGNGTASEPRMYQLIRQPGPVQDRQFEIEFLDPGVQAFDFTFG